MTTMIDGQALAAETLKKLAGEVQGLSKTFQLAGVLLGDSPSSKKFLDLKKKAAQEIGLDFEIYSFSEKISLPELSKDLWKMSQRPSVAGIIIELPLPLHLETQRILNLIPPEKDPDILSAQAQGDFFVGQSKILPPAVEAVKMILEKYDLSVRGKNCAVFGYGLLVGRPLSHWLASQGATVSIINEFTADPGAIASSADILITGVGQPGLVSGKMVKTGAVVIDFGYENKDGRIRGDVNFEEASRQAAFITPVPGGVGPLVVAAVLKNCLILASQNN